MTVTVEKLMGQAQRLGLTADRQQVHKDLLSEIDAVFVIYDNGVVRLGAGLEEVTALSGSGVPSAGEIVEGCVRLLTKGQHGKVALFLPSSEFAVTPFSFPGMSSDDIYEALRLQKKSNFPGLDEDLLLSVNVDLSQHEKSGFAFWLRGMRAAELYSSFEKHGLFLSVIAPRIVAHGGCSEGGLLDIDAQTRTYYCCAGGVVRQWQHVRNNDLDNKDFLEQWNNVVGEREGYTLADASVWRQTGQPDFLSLAVKFFPLRSARVVERRLFAKKIKAIFTGGLIALMLFLLPVFFFGIQSFYLQKHLSRLELDTAEIQRLQEAVLGSEEKWALMSEFPDQDIKKVLLVLNGSLPSDSWVRSISIENGVVEIEGYSATPASLIEVINENEMFDNVAFSHAVRSDNVEKGVDKFGLRFDLLGVEVEGYLQKYFSTNELR